MIAMFAQYLCVQLVHHKTEKNTRHTVFTSTRTETESILMVGYSYLYRENDCNNISNIMKQQQALSPWKSELG